MGQQVRINENLKVVVLAILVATTFWFFNALSKNYDKIINYPLAFEFNRDSLVIVDPLPTEIKIDVSSGGWNLLKNTFWFNATPVLITLDNPTDVKFMTKNSLMPIISNQLKELEINFLLTDTLFINIEPESHKKVQLILDSTFIDLRENYKITSPVVISPDSALIIGPTSLIENVRSPYFIKLNETDIDDDFRESIEIPLERKKIMKSIPGSINVTFDVEEFELINHPVVIETLNFPGDGKIYLADSMANVSFWINERLVKDINYSDFHITADLAMINEGDSTVPLMLMYFPEDAAEIEVKPSQMKLIYNE